MARCPFAMWRPVPSHGGVMGAQLGAVMHVTTNHASPYNYFANPANGASAHFWISGDGHLEQYVDTDVVSWAQAGGNHSYVSVETSGTPDVSLTEAQIGMFARLYRWGHDVHGWPWLLAEKPGDRGLGWHGMGGAGWGGHVGCPGDLRRGQRARIVSLADPEQRIVPMYDPPVRMAGIVADVFVAGVGYFQLSEDGWIHPWLGGSVSGAPASDPRCQGKGYRWARIEADAAGVTCVTTTGLRFGYGH